MTNKNAVDSKKTQRCKQICQRRRRMNSGEGKVVCVTGGSGYIGSWLVKSLLDRGYTVRASVRHLNDPKKTERLISLDGAKERLHLFQADLLQDGSFDPVVDGCDGVFHVASPVLVSYTDPEAELVEPAVRGTLNVLQACARATSVKRVVLTSSMAAAQFNGQLKDGAIVDESWFSDPSYCKELKLWYPLSKVLAENAAWKFCKERGIDMVAILPGMVFGPLLQPQPSLTVRLILNLVQGDAVLFRYSRSRWVDVRDVVTAHILAFEMASASGRYCLVERAGHTSEIIHTVNTLCPTLHLSDISSNGNFINLPEYMVSNDKAKGLGVEFIPLEVTLKDTIDSLKEKKLIRY